MNAAPLSVLDELFLHLDSPAEPWSVHYELGVEGRLDPDRLLRAVHGALVLHPMGRARLAAWSGSDAAYSWTVDDVAQYVPLTIAECPDAVALARARGDLLSFSPSLERSPPFALTLARGAERDSLIINMHHAASDGVGLQRLMRSIVCAYAGRQELEAPDPLEARDLRGLVQRTSLLDRATKVRGTLEMLSEASGPPARLARDGGEAEDGYGFELFELDDEDLAQVLARRREGQTVNDVLLAALGIAIDRWNLEHDQPSGRIALMMPVNLRPREWSGSIVANFASYITISLHAAERSTLADAAQAIARRTQRVKRARTDGLLIDVLALPMLLPIALRRRMPGLISIAENRLVDTAVLSNLGRLTELPEMGEAGRVREVYFSPPGRMPLGASLGVATLGGRMFGTLRYRRALFDADGARRFAALLRAILVEET